MLSKSGWQKILMLVFTLALVFVISRSLIRTLPGDPIETLIAESGTRIDPQVIREQLGLDRPFLLALIQDLQKMCDGDWGTSLVSNRPVMNLLTSRLGDTFELAWITLIIGLIISVPLGLLAAATPRGCADRFCSWYGSLAAALPVPWTGPVLMYLFAVLIPVFPLGGSVWLPAITLSFGFSGLWSRIIRNRVRETLAPELSSSPSVSARARGLPEYRILIKYGLNPCSGTLVAWMGTQIGGLLTGTFVTELIFSRPGMGELFIESVLSRDYPVVEAAVFVSASIILVCNLAGDLAQVWIDPRLNA